MHDEKDILKPPIWRTLEITNVQKGMAALAPEQMSTTWQDATDEQLEAFIDQASQKGSSVNLNIPATQESISVFFDKVFKCKRCGRCCRGDFPSAGEIQLRDAIPILDEEISHIANFLQVRPRRIKRLCKQNSQGGLSLPCPCPFYSNTPKPGCSVYSVRPIACRTYPLYSIYPIYSAPAHDVFKEKLNEKPLLSIDAKCPQAGEVALQLFKQRREAAQSGQMNMPSGV